MIKLHYNEGGNKTHGIIPLISVSHRVRPIEENVIDPGVIYMFAISLCANRIEKEYSSFSKTVLLDISYIP